MQIPNCLRNIYSICRNSAQRDRKAIKAKGSTDCTILYVTFAKSTLSSKPFYGSTHIKLNGSLAMFTHRVANLTNDLRGEITHRFHSNS